MLRSGPKHFFCFQTYQYLERCSHDPERAMYRFGIKFNIMKKILLAIIVFGIAFSCQEENPSLKDDDNQDQDLNDFHENSRFLQGTPPVIGRFSPRYGVPGTEVTILGSGFGATTADNRVGFTQSVPGHVTTWVKAVLLEGSPDRIKAILPDGAITGKIIVVARFEEFIGYSYGSATSGSDFEVVKDIPRNGLIRYYPFNNSFNEGLEGILNFNHFTTIPPAFTDDRFSRPQLALTFDGSNLALANGMVVPDVPWTISLWMNYSSLSGSRGILNTFDGYVGMDISLVPSGAGYVVRALGQNGNATPVQTLTNVFSEGYLPTTSGGWANITLTYDGTTIIVYVNGAIADTNETAPGIVGATTDFVFGFGVGGFFNGQLDDLIIYDRVLPDTEVHQLVEQTFSKYY